MKSYPVHVSFTVPKGTKALLKTNAAARGVSMSELIRRITSAERLATLSR